MGRYELLISSPKQITKYWFKAKLMVKWTLFNKIIVARVSRKTALAYLYFAAFKIPIRKDHPVTNSTIAMNSNKWGK